MSRRGSEGRGEAGGGGGVEETSAPAYVTETETDASVAVRNFSSPPKQATEEKDN